MKSNDAYEAWKQQARQIDISDGFSDQVIDRLRGLEDQSKHPWLNLETILDRITARPFVKVAFVGAGAVAGFLRIFLAAYALLNC